MSATLATAALRSIFWRISDLCGSSEVGKVSAASDAVEGLKGLTPWVYGGGRYWDRTSDPCRVKAVLYR